MSQTRIKRRLATTIRAAACLNDAPKDHRMVQHTGRHDATLAHVDDAPRAIAARRRPPREVSRAEHRVARQPSSIAPRSTKSPRKRWYDRLQSPKPAVRGGAIAPIRRARQFEAGRPPKNAETGTTRRYDRLDPAERATRSGRTARNRRNEQSGGDRTASLRVNEQDDSGRSASICPVRLRWALPPLPIAGAGEARAVAPPPITQPGEGERSYRLPLPKPAKSGDPTAPSARSHAHSRIVPSERSQRGTIAWLRRRGLARSAPEWWAPPVKLSADDIQMVTAERCGHCRARGVSGSKVGDAPGTTEVVGGQEPRAGGRPR